MPFVIKLFQYQVPSLNYSTSSLPSHFIAQLFEESSQHEKKRKTEHLLLILAAFEQIFYV